MKSIIIGLIASIILLCAILITIQKIPEVQKISTKSLLNAEYLHEIAVKVNESHTSWSAGHNKRWDSMSHEAIIG